MGANDNGVNEDIFEDCCAGHGHESSTRARLKLGFTETTLTEFPDLRQLRAGEGAVAEASDTAQANNGNT